MSSDLSELVGRPEAGRAYGEAVRPRIDDVGPDRRVRLDALARWLQDAAYYDLVDAGWPTPAPWLVRRLRLRVLRFPAFAEAIELTTWCSGTGPAIAERRTTIRGDRGAHVEAVALWVSVDPVAQRPAPLDARFVAVYGEAAGRRRVRTKLRHGAPPADAAASPFAFRATDLDAAGHVNNAAYWSVLEEERAGPDAGAPLDAEIEHRRPGDAGPVTLLTVPGARWVADPSGAVLASFRL